MNRTLYKSIFSALIIMSSVIAPGKALLANTIDEQQTVITAAPNWLEPQGIHVVNLVGAVPEEHLRNTIITSSPAFGIIQYLEGSRNGEQVVVKVRIWPRYKTDETIFGCLGQRAYSDFWPAAVPESTMQIFSGGTNITHFIYGAFYTPSSQMQPLSGTGPPRYGEPPIVATGQQETLTIPANQYCMFLANGRHTDVTAVFTFNFHKQIRVRALGEETFNFGGYRGPGFAGRFGALQNQLSTYGRNHEKFNLNIPEGTDYVFVKYPPTPVNVNPIDDVETNVLQPASGTYRLASGTSAMSTDYIISMGIPLYAVWQDADQTGGRYLKQLSGINMIGALEYFVPVGIEYDSCMQNGGCSSSVMQKITSQRMDMTIYYYQVERIAGGLTRIPLRQVGPDWKPSDAFTADNIGLLKESVVYTSLNMLQLPTESLLFLPQVSTPLPLPVIPDELPEPNLPPDDPNGCPCGWFTDDGRMLDYIPAP